MRRTLSLLAFSSVFSMIALAGSFSGKLLDAACYEQQKTVASCDATSTTTAFALDVSGNVFTLDAAGNTKAANAMKNRADRAADPAKPESKTIMAKVQGTESAKVIAVESIEVQ